MHNGNSVRRRERKEQKKYLNNNDWEFPHINIRYQITDPGSSENTKQKKCQKKTDTMAYHFQSTENQR